MSALVLVSALTLTTLSSLLSTAVLNMDNAVVDLETLQALYENVSLSGVILDCGEMAKMHVL